MTALYISRRWYMTADIIDVIIGSDGRELEGAPLVKLIYFNQKLESGDERTTSLYLS